jgi:hypothetical protein
MDIFIRSVLEVINVNLECCQSMVSLKMWKSHDPLQLTGTHSKDRTYRSKGFGRSLKQCCIKLKHRAVLTLKNSAGTQMLKHKCWYIELEHRC